MNLELEKIFQKIYILKFILIKNRKNQNKLVKKY